MAYESRTKQHEVAALREEDAAARAASRESARLHAALAKMHRHEAAKMESVRHALRLAFGD